MMDQSDIIEKIKGRISRLKEADIKLKEAEQERKSYYSDLYDPLRFILMTMGRAEGLELQNYKDTLRGTKPCWDFNTYKTYGRRISWKSISYLSDFIQVRYTIIDNIGDGDFCTQPYKTLIPYKYFGFSEKQISEVHREWIAEHLKNKLQAVVDEAAKLSEELENRNESVEYQQYLKLKEKFES